MRGSSSFTVRVLIAGVLILFGVAACGTASKGGNGVTLPTGTPSAAQSVLKDAKTPAQAAQAQLTADGYTLVRHLPEFGKVAFGINLTATNRYEGVAIVNNAQDAAAAVKYYDQHPQTGVTVTSKTTGSTHLVIIRFDTLKHGEAAVKALSHDAHISAKNAA